VYWAFSVEVNPALSSPHITLSHFGGAQHTQLMALANFKTGQRLLIRVNSIHELPLNINSACLLFPSVRDGKFPDISRILLFRKHNISFKMKIFNFSSIS